MPEKWTGAVVGKMHCNKVRYEELSSELGISKQYLSMILNGTRRPDGMRERVESALDDIIERRKGE